MCRYDLRDVIVVEPAGQRTVAVVRLERDVLYTARRTRVATRYRTPRVGVLARRTGDQEDAEAYNEPETTTCGETTCAEDAMMNRITWDGNIGSVNGWGYFKISKYEFAQEPELNEYFVHGIYVKKVASIDLAKQEAERQLDQLLADVDAVKEQADQCNTTHRGGQG